MNGDDQDLLAQAVDELYGLDPSGFVDRRRELAKQARDAGNAAAAGQIVALRRPTVSVWTLNMLARSKPEVIDELVGLGEQLRQAEQNLDGDQLRELSRQRRGLVESLASAAFTAAGLRSPSATVRDEVIATVSAAIADPQVGEQLREGRLSRAVHWHGFGSASPPGLAIVPDAATSGVDGSVGSANAGAGSASAKAASAMPASAMPASASAAREAEAARRHQRRLAKAESEFALVRERLSAAQSSESEWTERVHQQQEQLAAAQRELDTARLEVRHAKIKLDKAELVLDELR